MLQHNDFFTSNFSMDMLPIRVKASYVNQFSEDLQPSAADGYWMQLHEMGEESDELDEVYEQVIHLMTAGNVRVVYVQGNDLYDVAEDLLENYHTNEQASLHGCWMDPRGYDCQLGIVLFESIMYFLVMDVIGEDWAPTFRDIDHKNANARRRLRKLKLLIDDGD